MAGIELTYKQTEALDYLEDKETVELLFGGGAGPGKSTLICYFGLKMSLKYPGARGCLGRSILKTLRETTLKTFIDTAKMMGVHKEYKIVGPSLIRFKNGSEILLKDLYAYPSDPEFDELGSLELTWAGIDECNQVTKKAKDILKSRIRYKLDEFGLMPKLAMSCNPAKNWTKKDFYDLAVKGTLPKKRKFVPALLTDNKFIQSTYDELLADLDKASQQRLRFGNWEFDSDPSALMTLEDIAAIFTNKFVLPIGKKYITADIARQGSDKTVIRVWHGWVCIERVVLKEAKTTVSSAKIKELANKHMIPMHQVICDEDGVGGGVVDQLGCKGFVNNSTCFDIKDNNNFANLKAQCAWYLAKKVSNSEVYDGTMDSDTADDVATELAQVKKDNIDSDGRNTLLSKKKVKLILGYSPDDADTFIMRSWFDLDFIKNQGPSIILPGELKTTNGRTI